MQFPHAVLFHRTKMSPLQLTCFVRDVLLRDAIKPPTVYDAGQCLLVWVAQLLEQLPTLDPQRRRWLLAEIRGPVYNLGCARGAAVDAASPRTTDSWVLAFAEDRYVTWTGRAGFLDLATGDGLQSLPRPALATTAFNIVEVFARGQQRCQQLQRTLERQGGQDATRGPDTACETPALVDA